MPQPPLGASIWQVLAAAGHPVGTLMRQLGAGLLAPNSASEVDSLMSTIGKIVGEGPPGVNLGMMPMGPGGFRLPPLPRGIPMKTAINLLHPDLQLPHMTGTPEEGLQRVIPTWSGDVKGAAEHVMRPASGNAGLSTPGAWKPVPGVQQNLGLNTESLPVDNPSPRKASTLSPSPSQPRPITPLDPTKVAPNSPEVTQRLHDGYLATWRNLSVSPPLQQLFERSLQRFIQDASAKGASHDIAELNGAKRALESIMKLKNPPPPTASIPQASKPETHVGGGAQIWDMGDGHTLRSAGNMDIARQVETLHGPHDMMVVNGNVIDPRNGGNYYVPYFDSKTAWEVGHPGMKDSPYYVIREGSTYQVWGKGLQHNGIKHIATVRIPLDEMYARGHLLPPSSGPSLGRQEW